MCFIISWISDWPSCHCLAFYCQISCLLVWWWSGAGWFNCDMNSRLFSRLCWALLGHAHSLCSFSFGRSLKLFSFIRLLIRFRLVGVAVFYWKEADATCTFNTKDTKAHDHQISSSYRSSILLYEYWWKQYPQVSRKNKQTYQLLLLFLLSALKLGFFPKEKNKSKNWNKSSPLMTAINFILFLASKLWGFGSKM